MWNSSPVIGLEVLNIIQTILFLNPEVCAHVCVLGGVVGGAGLIAHSSLSSSLTQRCTCDHSDILFESIRVPSGGFTGGWGSAF